MYIYIEGLPVICPFIQFWASCGDTWLYRAYLTYAVSFSNLQGIRSQTCTYVDICT